MAVLWLILSLVDQPHLLQLLPRQQCLPSSIAIHDARGDGIYLLWLDRAFSTAAPHCRWVLRHAVAINTCSSNKAYASSNLHRAVLARPLPHDHRRFKTCDRRKKYRFERGCSEETHKIVTRTSRKPSMGAYTTKCVARATRSVTAFTCALFRHRKRTLGISVGPCERYAWT